MAMEIIEILDVEELCYFISMWSNKAVSHNFLICFYDMTSYMWGLHSIPKLSHWLYTYISFQTCIVLVHKKVTTWSLIAPFHDTWETENLYSNGIMFPFVRCKDHATHFLMCHSSIFVKFMSYSLIGGMRQYILVQLAIIST